MIKYYYFVCCQVVTSKLELRIPICYKKLKLNWEIRFFPSFFFFLVLPVSILFCLSVIKPCKYNFKSHIRVSNPILGKAYIMLTRLLIHAIILIYSKYIHFIINGIHTQLSHINLPWLISCRWIASNLTEWKTSHYKPGSLFYIKASIAQR